MALWIISKVIVFVGVFGIMCLCPDGSEKEQ